jgi:hypothetical protein
MYDILFSSVEAIGQCCCSFIRILRMYVSVF